MQWNWTEEKTAQWLQPAIEAPYLALRWKEQGFWHFLDNGCGSVSENRTQIVLYFR